MTGRRRRGTIDCGGEEATIFESVSSSPLDDRYGTGSFPGEGTFFCLICGSQLALEEVDELPACSSCGGSQFRRDSIFSARQDHGAATSEFPVPGRGEPPEWLDAVRAGLRAGSGYHLALQDQNDEIVRFAVERGWTRIGRSPTADLRLDDPSVSRRHALVVAEPGKPLRVLDDRSLNGLLLNGEPVEWAPLGDGDELTIGRFHLYVLKP